ncbi:hypothetical protein B9Z55_007791 [Caenorhabditis nigoni]|uniref:Uncharacterized protein n=1 Tax=Caenorhabditis nigoni TaxID=1611254 RepID=A0A2G5VB83_9PELO|nr:hypothetical protein B9Z55_007791 [Caenorhabditis nigoni]
MSSWDLQTHGTGSQKFTETQIESCGYYNRGPFDDIQYDSFYPMYEPVPPLEPKKKRKIANRRREFKSSNASPWQCSATSVIPMRHSMEPR